ncbi:MAG: hypothetical protein U0768_18080 [Anaerolineae bacterium]
MKLVLLILGLPTLFIFLLTASMVRSAQTRYRRGRLDRGALVGQLGLAAALWASLVFLAAALMVGLGVGAKSPLLILVLALLVGAVSFGVMSRGLLWGRA